MKLLSSLFAILCLAATAHADLIDFENAAAWGGDNARITSTYLDMYGVSISAVAGDDEDDAESENIRFEDAGNGGQSGFRNDDNDRDTVYEGSLGNYFMKVGRGGVALNNERYLQITINFDTGTEATSGTIWDIDGAEQFGVVGFDAAGNEVASLESPIGGMDGLPWTWSMTVGGGVTISTLEITKIGNARMRGFGFDDFNTTDANAFAQTHNVPIPAAFPLGCLGLAAVMIRTRRRSHRFAA